MLRPNLRHLSYSLAALAVMAIAAPAPATAQTHYESIGWTPDGRALTVSAGGDIYRLPLDGGPAERLTPSESRDIHASWAPDGSAFAFGSYRDGAGEIFVAGPNGSGARALTDDEVDDSAPAWSPDGRRIAFMKETGEHWQIWLMDTDGSNPRRLTHSDGNDFNPRWSPDGEWIVFESSRHEGDQDEIYLMRPDGTDERRLTDTPGNDIYPDWSPDGERIAYCTIERGRAFVHVIPAAGGEPELLLEDACHPAWSPDGNRLAYVSVARGEPRRLWVSEPDGSGAAEVAGLEARPVVNAAETATGSLGDDEAAPRKPRVAILILRRRTDHRPCGPVGGAGSVRPLTVSGRVRNTRRCPIFVSGEWFPDVPPHMADSRASGRPAAADHSIRPADVRRDRGAHASGARGKR